MLPTAHLNTETENAFFFVTKGSKQLNLVASKPKHSFGNIERQKCSLVTNKEENVLLRKMMLKTAEPSQKQAKTLFQVKSSQNQRHSLQPSKTSFPVAITLETGQFYRKQANTYLWCNEAESSVF